MAKGVEPTMRQRVSRPPTNTHTSGRPHAISSFFRIHSGVHVVAVASIRDADLAEDCDEGIFCNTNPSFRVMPRVEISFSALHLVNSSHEHLLRNQWNRPHVCPFVELNLVICGTGRDGSVLSWGKGSEEERLFYCSDDASFLRPSYSRAPKAVKVVRHEVAGLWCVPRSPAESYEGEGGCL